MPIQIADAYRNSSFAQLQTGLLFNLPVPDPDHEQLPEGISLCMIVKNEERFLAECLESVKGVVDEICIVDTGSTDRTVEIAESYGARIEHHEWRKDFAWARNKALAMATRRWTFVLDADEELEKESVELMKSLRTTPAGLCCIYINITNTIDDSAGAGTMSHRLIRVFPTNPLLRFIGVIHESMFRTDAKELEAVLAPITILHKGYTGEMLVGREKDARNKPLISRAYEENGDDAFSMFNFGNSAICSGNAEVGCEVLERLLAMPGPSKLYFPLAYLLLTQAYCEQFGDNQRALDKIDEAIARYPNDAGLVFTKGQVVRKMDRWDEAQELFERALTLRELMAYSVMTDEELFEWKIFFSLAGIYEHKKEFDKAIEYVEAALANKPRSFVLQRAKATFLENLGRFYDAELAFRRMAEAEPERGRVELVNYLLRRHRYAQAIAIVENEIEPGMNGEIVANLNLAAARGMMEANYGDPMPYLEAALRHAPGNGAALSLKERVLTERGDTAGLAKLHEEEMLAPVTRPADFVRRTQRLLALKRNEEARFTAEQGLHLDQSNPELRFNLALACLRLGDETQATRELARVEDRSPEAFASAMQMRAALLLRAGNPQEALSSLEQRLAAMPNNVSAVLDSARTLIGGGARAEARTLLEAHLETDQQIALELTQLLLQDGDIAGAGRVATAALK
ncbi:MAG TPA: glycosyltransferase [Candidatus Lustribacter sp.]|jgi:tetratricopeptide (TPR) repeat protein|nr:glycosyltransferase [Candidatus Lustribacter sp.]